MRRRELIGAIGLTALSPIATRAQQGAPPIVGILNHNTTPEAGAPYLAAVRQGLGDLGYEEGHNVAIAMRYGLGQADRLRALADELVRLKVAVIFASGGPGNAVPERNATTTIPIVFVTAGDVVKGGLITALNRPGGNATGVLILAYELDAKRLEMLDQILPKQATIGFLLDEHNTSADDQAAAVKVAARALGRQLTVTRVSAESDIGPAFAAMAARKDGGVAVGASAYFNGHRPHIVQLAARYALPAIYEWREFVLDGGLMSYGTDLAASYRLAGRYVARVLNGEKPADMPVQQATTFNLVINLKLAKSLGLTFPLPLLARADEVIE